MDKVVHFEIPADNPARVEKFFKEVFGWNVTKVEGGMPYWICRTSECDEENMPKEVGSINGGIYKRNDESSRTPSIVMNVEDIEKSIKKIKEKGGKVLFEPKEVMGMGRYTQFKDTEGNIHGLWQNLMK
ncbi:VOC family protein [Candidatus Woesearchaeota archaeon]|nr:VOC family protein [Candidatus Woesearchaeota archaeon]